MRWAAVQQMVKIENRFLEHFQPVTSSPGDHSDQQGQGEVGGGDGGQGHGHAVAEQVELAIHL